MTTFDTVTNMAIDWTNIHKKYKGLWVALAKDEKTVLETGTSAEEVFTKAQKAGHIDPILTRMPEDLTAYVGYGV